MALSVVDRSGSVVRLIAAHEFEALLATWTPGHRASEVQQALAMSVLRMLHLTFVLACDCTARPSEQAPRMCVRRHGSGLGLVQHNQSTHPHRPDCPFHRLVKRPLSPRDDLKAGSPDQGVTPLDQDWTVLHPSRRVQPAAPVPDRNVVGDAHVRTPALARILWTVLTRAGFTRLDGSTVTQVKREGRTRVEIEPPWQVTRMLRDLSAMPVIGGLTFEDLVCVWPGNLAAFCERALPARARSFPTGVEPQGFAIFLAKSVNKDAGNVSGFAGTGTDPLEVQANRSLHQFGRTGQGPFWAIAVLGAGPDQRYRPIDIYAHPALSWRCPIPVDSDFERSVLYSLLGVLGWMASEGVQVGLEKPLFDEPVEGGTVRPDFTLRVGTSRVLVEAMGLAADPTYVARKRTQIERMRQLSDVVEVIEIEPGQDRMAVRIALARAVRRAARRNSNRISARSSAPQAVPG